MYHISDIKRFLKCERLYYYTKDQNNVFRPYLRSDENITDLLKIYFDIDNCFEGVRNDLNDRFFSEIDNYEWFIHPRFADGELRLNVPLMHKVEDAYVLYFIYYVCRIRELDLLTSRITVKMLEKLGLKVASVNVICFNEDYVNEGRLEEKKLFICKDKYKGRKIIDVIREKNVDYEKIINDMENYDPDAGKAEKNRFCKLYGLCDYYAKCFPDEAAEPDDSILTLVSSQNKNRMHEQGKKQLKDADPDLLEGNRIQYAQIMASRNGGLYVEKLALTYWLSKLEKRPISFIDFEWDRYLVPAYPGMKPLDVVCFEFALYYIDENGTMEHRTFVSTGDCRKEFVEALIAYLPAEGPILAYNAKGAECLRLQELADLYPEYKDKLENIIGRFIDLAEPFLEGLVYDVRMKGNYTLKQLVDICSDYSYSDLDIYDGMEAVFNWRNVDKNQTEDGGQIIENLKEYCSLDAYGLFLVYRWLIKLAIES